MKSTSIFFFFWSIFPLALQPSNSVTPNGFAALNEQILRDLLLTPDGANINGEFLRQLIKTFAKQLSQIGPVGRSTFTVAGINTTSALDSFVNVGGRRPSTADDLKTSIFCDICATTLDILGPIALTDAVYPKVLQLAKKICLNLTGFSQEICDGYVDEHGPVLHYVMPHLTKSPYTLCSSVLDAAGYGEMCGAPDYPHPVRWAVPIPDPLPNPIPPTGDPNAEKDTTMVAFTTDFHVDPYYQPGSIAECIEPVCCRNSSTSSKETVEEWQKAGFWGSYGRCDLSPWALIDMFRHMNETFGTKIDFLFNGGDVMPHDSWRRTTEGNNELFQTVADIITEKLPDIPFYFTFGNHEAIPVNCFAFPGDPPQFSNERLYEKYADVMAKWLDKEAIANLKYGGFYSVLLKPGWRLITLNDNICYSQDWFQWARDSAADPFGQLEWMVKILAEAEKKGERVQIVAHVSPGDGSCVQVWSWNYHRIINRFNHVISGQFFGHAHDDFFKIYFDAETLTQPQAVSFVGPPGTTYGSQNVAYRIYEFDTKTYTLQNYYQYYADISANNRKGDKTQMDWKLEYSAKEEYPLPDMSAASWKNLADRMQTDYSLLDKYRRHFTVSIGNGEGYCDAECHRFFLCRIYQSMSQVSDEWCFRFIPSIRPYDEDATKRKCSRRFHKQGGSENTDCVQPRDIKK